MSLDLDINSDLFALEINDRFVRAAPPPGPPRALIRPPVHTVPAHLKKSAPMSTAGASARAQTFALASTLALDGSQDAGTFDQSGGPSLLDQYDYAMYGKLYKWKQDTPKAPVEVYVSFGGLLMRLKGDPRHLAKLQLDARVYLLLRKIALAQN